MNRPHDGGPILSRQQIRVATQPFLVAEKAATEKKPAVTVTRDSDRIREIHIHCACGESIVLECDYNGTVTVPPHRHGNPRP